jgi:mannitol/fructose-specific phosphotransferase system IIA component (Ntr-type)
MRLTDLLKPENVRLPIEADDKVAAIEELVGLLEKNGELQDPARVRESVLERERTRTTGIGDGLAIPHGKTEGVAGLVMAFGRAKTPIDFEAIDGKPVTLVWLLASPIHSTAPHLNALARVSKIMSRAPVRKKLLAAETARQMYDIIAEQDEQF